MMGVGKQMAHPRRRGLLGRFGVWMLVCAVVGGLAVVAPPQPAAAISVPTSLLPPIGINLDSISLTNWTKYLTVLPGLNLDTVWALIKGNEPWPDFKVGSVSGPATANRGETIEIGVSVKNKGGVKDKGKLYYLLTPGNSLPADLGSALNDYLLYTQNVEIPGETTKNFAATVKVPNTASLGTRYLFVIAVPNSNINPLQALSGIPDPDVSNNVGGPTAITITAITPPGGQPPAAGPAPDLTLSDFNFFGTTGAPQWEGQFVQVQMMCANGGNAHATGDFDYTLYLYKTGQWVPLQNRRWTSTINIGGDSYLGFDFYVPDWAQGTWELRAVVDSGVEVAELDETNNTLATSVTIAHAPNLVVTEFSGPEVVRPGHTVSVSAKVNNIRDIATGPSTLKIRWADGNTHVQSFLGEFAIPALAPGGSKEVAGSVVIPVGAEEGYSHLLGANLYTTGIPGEMIAGNWKGGYVTADITPPAAPTAFVATGSDSGASLVWTNPADVDFHRTRVLRSTAGYASSPQPGGSQKLVDEVGGARIYADGLEDGGTYYFSAFAVDEAGNFSATPAKAAATLEPIGPPIAGPADGDEDARLSPWRPGAGDSISGGGCADIDGDTIVVGSHSDDVRGDNSGSVYVYVREGSGWVQQAKLDLT